MNRDEYYFLFSQSEHAKCDIQLLDKFILNNIFYAIIRPDFLDSLVYDNFFQRSNVGDWNKNKNKISQGQFHARH